MKQSSLFSVLRRACGFGFLALCTAALVPACGSNDDGGSEQKTTGKQKAGGAKGAQAQQSGQKSGSQATGSATSGTDQGSEKDGVTCDASLEDIAWCETEQTIVVCHGGSWWAVDCAMLDEAAYCGYDLEANVVDCYVDEWDDGDDGADWDDGADGADRGDWNQGYDR